MRVQAVVTFTMEYDIAKDCYPVSCQKIEDYIAIDKAQIREDYAFVLDSCNPKMEVEITEVVYSGENMEDNLPATEYISDQVVL